MNWAEILTQIILCAVGLAFSVLGTVLTAWVAEKVKNEKAKKFMNEALTIVGDGVDFVYQTYVDELKHTSLWDEAAKATAKEKATEYVNNSLQPKLLEFLKNNFSDVQEWIENQIEIAIQKKKD